jgi:TolA-binding protein
MYLARQFLSAAYAFGKITSKYPSFHLVDQAAFYKGKAFENSNLNQAAREVYEDALRKYTDSDLRPQFMFQLMNIDYREGKFDEASRLYEQIVNLYPESDAKGDADYVMGQIKYSKEDYNGAIALLTTIPAGNANYPYARYTMGESYAGLENLQAAEKAFLDVTQIKPSNASEQEIKDVSLVKLGDINFGKPQLKQAAEYYSSVSANSTKYDEALLGLAWAFLKEKNFKSASEYAQAIILKTPNSLLVPEAHLLLGYCAYFTQNYDPAVAEFDKAADLAAQKVASLQEQKRAWAENPMTSSEFLAVQEEALELSDQLPTDRILAKQEELRPRFDAVNTKVEQYLEFEQDADTYDRVLQDEDRVIKDAKFTRATVLDLKSGSGQKHAPSQQDLKELDVQ